MAEENNENKGNQINIELNEEVAEGVYSNLAVITHSQTEFVLDFVRVMPGVPKAKVKSRVILTPFHAKRLLRALGDNLAKYESVHGVVDESGQGNDGGNGPGTPPFPVNFGGPTTQA